MIISRLNELTRRYANINWALADQALVSGGTFLTGVLIARFLGVEEFGRFALSWMAVFFVQVAQVAAITSPLMTIGVKKDQAQRARYMGSVVIHQVVFAIITTLLTFTLLSLADNWVPEWRLSVLALPVALLVFFGQIQDFLRRHFFCVFEGHNAVLIDTLRFATQLIVLFTVLSADLLEMSLQSIYYLLAATSFAGCVVGAILFCKVQWDLPYTFQILKEHWKFSKWLLGSSIAEWMRGNFILTVVGVTLGVAEAGIFRAAQQLVLISNVPLLAFSNIVPVRAAHAYQAGGFDGLMDFVRSFVVKYQALIAAGVITLGIFGEFAITLVYGAEYAGYGYLVLGFAFIQLIYIMRDVTTNMLRAMEQTRYEFIAYSFALAAMFLTAHPLIQAYGKWGALVCDGIFHLTIALILTLGIVFTYREQKKVTASEL